jgi:predicted metal-dependent hydrolase
VEFVYQRTDLTKVEVKRSKRAKRNVTAYRDNDKTVVTVPTRMAKRDIDAYVAELVNRLDDRDERTSSQEALEQRARVLSRKYLGQDLFETHKVPVKFAGLQIKILVGVHALRMKERFGSHIECNECQVM